MTFEEIQDEIIAIRFRESQRTSVKHWINLRYQMIWAIADWPFKFMGPVNLTVTSGDATPTLPSDFHRPIDILDDAGFPLSWLEAKDFDRAYEGYTLQGVTAIPDSFKWVDDVITLYPTPDANYTFRLTYERRITHNHLGSTPTVGLMSDDSDTPLWDAEHHYLLVPAALSLGLRLENDPTYPAVEEDFQSALQLMREHYLPSAAPGGHLQYGRDQLGV
jgi:hypothetical protein